MSKYVLVGRHLAFILTFMARKKNLIEIRFVD